MSVPFETKHFTSVEEVIQYMETMVGYLEKANGSNLGDFTEAGKTVNAGSNNYTIYWDWYKTLGYGNLQGSAYCACFVSVILASAFGLDVAKKLLCGDLYIYCPTGYNQFKSQGRIYEAPEVGDVVFFWGDSQGRWSHTGYVVGVDNNGNGVTTIEANTSSGNNVVVPNGGATCKKHYALKSRKMAFGRPDYEGYGISIEAIPEVITEYDVEAGKDGLLIIGNLNVRKSPGTHRAIVKVLQDGEIVHPTKKAFVNGAPWYYDEKHGGWFSGKYMQGWIRDIYQDNKWWYVEKGYKYPVNEFRYIDSALYYFDDSGYMFVGTMTITTDENGVIKKADDSNARV